MAANAQIKLVDSSPSPRPSPPGRGSSKRRVLPIRKPVLQSPSPESGAEATAVQTLRDELVRPSCAKRLDCGAFTAALAWQDNRLSYRMMAARVSPSPGGEGRGEGERHTIRLTVLASLACVLLTLGAGCRESKGGAERMAGADSAGVTTDISIKVTERDRDKVGEPDSRIEQFYRGDERIMLVFKERESRGDWVVKSRSYSVKGSMAAIDHDDDGDGVFETFIIYHESGKDVEVFTRQPDRSVSPASTRVVEAHKKQSAAFNEFFEEMFDKNQTPTNLDGQIIEERIRATQKKVQEAQKEIDEGKQ